MTGDDLPTTPGSLASDELGHRYSLECRFADVLRWVSLTRFTRRSLTPDELAARTPTVLYVAPPWTDPAPLKETP